MMVFFIIIIVMMGLLSTVEFIYLFIYFGVFNVNQCINFKFLHASKFIISPHFYSLFLVTV